MSVSLAQRAESLRAYHRAVATLQEGDKVCVSRCGGGRATFRFVMFDGYWMIGKGGQDDYAPSAIVSLNGEKVSFRDPPWERKLYDPRTGRPFGDHGTESQACEWIVEVCNDTDPANTAEFLRAWREGGAWEECR